MKGGRKNCDEDETKTTNDTPQEGRNNRPDSTYNWWEVGVQATIINVSAIEYVLERIKIELQKSNSDLPCKIKDISREVANQQRRITHLIEVVAEGRGTKSITDALAASERKVEELTASLEVLRRSQTDSFQTPPRVWIEERLQNLQQVLERNTGASAPLVRRIFGPIRLEVVVPEVGKQYYVARSRLNVVELLNVPATKPDLDSGDEGPKRAPSSPGSNTLRWWRRGELNPRPKAFRRWPLHA